MQQDQTLQRLLVDTKRVCAEPQFNALLYSQLKLLAAETNEQRLMLEIHPSDQMLIHSLAHHQNAAIALSQYFNISLQQFSAAKQVLSSFFDVSDQRIKLLDFACGYGRLLRLLSAGLPNVELWASEIQQDALTFVSKTFGARAIASALNPKDFKCDEHFDFIWVASLFSHLPDSLFQEWLEKLLSLLSPRGVLCFSVRSSDLLGDSAQLPKAGILFSQDSEVSPLHGAVYGTSYASEEYVKAVIKRVMDDGHPYQRLPRALANEQDLYIVARNSANPTLRVKDSFRRGAWGWLDTYVVSDNYELLLRGWATCLDTARLAFVQIQFAGNAYRVQASQSREDVAQVLADSRFLSSGWTFQLQLDADWRSEFLFVTAHTHSGGQALLFAGKLDELIN